jgi:hypothetical protein
MYKREPTAQELASVGLEPEDYEEELIEIWPENIPVYDLWGIVGDQWRMGFNGPVALDLIPVFHELDRMGLDGEAYDAMLDGIKAMAGAAMLEIHAGQ